MVAQVTAFELKTNLDLPLFSSCTIFIVFIVALPTTSFLEKWPFWFTAQCGSDLKGRHWIS